jgi:hypothetical protein
VSEPTYDLFPNGTSHMMWRDRSCDCCWKSRVDEATGKSRCAIEYAIAAASVFDGTLIADGVIGRARAERLAKRLNWDGKSYLRTDCPERQEKRQKYTPHERSTESLPLFTSPAANAATASQV